MRSGTVQCSSRSRYDSADQSQESPLAEPIRASTAPAAPPDAGPRRPRARPRPRRDLGRLPEAAVGENAPSVEIERPADPRHGDLASNLAMKLARPCRMAPLEIASALKEELDREIETDAAATPIAGVDVALPGFINLRLADRALEGLLDAVLAAPGAWGTVEPVRPRRVNVEFVSANPTGPLHIGNARGAFVGDLLSRLLEAGGQTVTREYYFNDFGMQVRNLGASVLAIRRAQPVPEDGYHGDYVHDLARELPPDVEADAEAGEAADVIGRWASERVRRGIEGRSPGSGCASMCGPARAGCTTKAGSTARSSAFARTATSTSRTAPSGSGRLRSGMTRTGR